MNECAETTVHMSSYKMLHALPSDVFAAWVCISPLNDLSLTKDYFDWQIQYRQEWVALMTKEYSRFGPTRHHRGLLDRHCEIWAESYAVIAHDIGGKPESLLKLPGLLERRQLVIGNRCEDCKREIGYWYHQSTRDRKELPNLVDFL